MSKIEAPVPSDNVKIPIGRRIGEIMEERGGAFTQRSFAPRIGLSKDTLGRIIDGDRHVKPSELQRIAEGLSVSIVRLKQEDTYDLIVETERLLTIKKDLQRALMLAKKVHTSAIGITEKCDTSTLLARVIYALGDYDNAHQLLMQSYQYAEKLYQRYNDTSRLYNVLSKLMITFTVRKEFSNLSDILEQVETAFISDPEKQATIYFSKAMIAEQFGNIEQVRECLYKSLELYESWGKQNDIGRAEQNVGYFEFKQKNYSTAKHFLVHSIEHLAGDDYYQLIAIKELVKTLLKLEEIDLATEWLERSLERLDEFPELKGKFLLLLSCSKSDPAFAESIFMIGGVGKKVLRLTCKYLVSHYAKLGDSEAVMKYAVIGEKYSLSGSDLIHEEDL